MTDTAAPSTPAPAAPAAPAPAPAAEPGDSPQELRAAAMAKFTEAESAPKAEAPPPKAEPAEAGEDWTAIRDAARKAREEREAKTQAKTQESDRERAIREREERIAARERAFEDDPLSYLDRTGKTKPVYDKLTEKILADGKPVPLPKEEIERLAEEKATAIVERVLREREEKTERARAERTQADGHQQAMQAFHAHVGSSAEATPALAAVAPHIRAMYAQQVAQALTDAGRPFDFATVAKLAEQALRTDMPGWAPAGAGDRRDQAKGQSSAGEAAAHHSITGSLAGQSSSGEDDDDDPMILRRRAIRFAEKLDAS